MLDISNDILREAAQGNIQAFENVYKATANFVFNVAFRVVNNKEDAQEVVQEVYLMVYQKLKEFRFESSFKTWIYRITVNNAINFAKKNANARNKMNVYNEQLVAGSVPNDVHGDIEQEHHEKVVNRFLGAINPEQRACVVLRNVEGLSYQQIAETLQLNINTVRTRLKRAREKLLSLKKRVNDERMSEI